MSSKYVLFWYVIWNNE